MRLAFVLLTWLVACSGGSHPPATAPSRSNLPREVVANPTVGIGAHHLHDRDLAELKALGITHVRHTLYIETYLNAPEYRVWWRERVTVAANEGFRLLVVVHQLPESMGPDAFGAFMASVADLPVEAWQIGNEIPFGARHQEFHTAAYHRIKAADPSALVVTMALMTEEQARGWTAPTDIHALHLYGGLAAKARAQRAWLPAGVRVWATEFGEDVRLSSEAHQLSEWQAGIAAAHGYERMYGYQLRTEEQYEKHAIIRPDGSYRPVATWLASRPD